MHLFDFLGLEEYCFFDTFKAECSPSEIIMITEANYGRMRKGRCIQDNSGKNETLPTLVSILILTMPFVYKGK